MNFLKKHFSRTSTIFYLITGLLVIFLVTIHGLLPGTAGSVAGRYMLLGFMECGSQSLHALAHLHCSAVGGQAQGIMPTGSPIYVAGALLIRAFSLSPQWALLIVSIVVMTIALLGAYKFINNLGVSRYVALAVAFLYLGIAETRSMQAFGGTYWGMLLMPAAIYAVTFFLGKIRGSDYKTKILILAAWSAMSTTQLFIDGYSFFMTLAAAAGLIFFWSWKKWKKPDTWFAVMALLFATASAYLLYRRAIPGSSSWSTSPIGVFRSMSLDLVTIFEPIASIWWAHILDIKVNASKLWGDGSNSAYNYIGFSVIILAIVGIATSLKTKAKSQYTKDIKMRLIALMAVLLGSFILSLGPSLKWDAVRGPLKSPVTDESYLMPSDRAVVDLPTTVLYEKLPGLSSMRATYRWHLLTQFILLAFAAVGVQYIIKRKGYRYGVPVLLIVFLELSPNPYSLIKQEQQKGRQIDKFNSQVIEPLKSYVNKNDLVVFYPNAVGGNDYLANYIAPMLDIHTYNVGNDKSLVRAKRLRPPEVGTLLGLKDDNRASQDKMLVASILRDKTATAVIIPYFDLRWNAYAWPPRTQDGRIRALGTLDRIKDNPELEVQSTDLFSIVREKN